MAEQFKNSAKLNGFQPRSWGDVVAVATLIAMLMACVAWGLKLEARIDTLTDRQIDMARQIGVGVLPRADERITDLEKRQDRHERSHKSDH